MKEDAAPAPASEARLGQPAPLPGPLTDCAESEPWPTWKKLLAYLLLAALAGGSIWLIDRRAVVPDAGDPQQRAAE